MEPRGPSTTNTTGVQISRKIIGLRNALTTLGDTLSAKSSAQPMTGVINSIGSTELE